MYEIFKSETKTGLHLDKMHLRKDKEKKMAKLKKKNIHSYTNQQ